MRGGQIRATWIACREEWRTDEVSKIYRPVIPIWIEEERMKVPILVDMDEIRAYLEQNDIVEVVRCRDCKHWICNPNTEEWGKCKWISDEQFDVVMNDDDYCSYGERASDV